MIKKITLSILILSLLSCSTNYKKDKYTFYYALSGEPNYLNWVPYSSAYEADVIQMLYQSMMDIDYNNNNKLIPSLAEKIEVSPDKFTYTVYMKKNIVWQDGKPVTAKDVEFTYKKILDPKSGAQNKIGDLKDVKEFKIINKYRFAVIFKKRNVQSLLTVAGLTPIPKHIWKNKSMKDPVLNRNPIGNGPYKFKSWNTGRSITLVLNKKYKAKTKPFFKKIIYKIIPENAAQIAALRKGTIDFVERIKPRTWFSIQKKPNFTKKFTALKYDATMYSHIAWQGNGTNPFFSDKRVRLAMTHALDRIQIIKKIRLGLATIQTGPFYPTSWANDPAVKPHDYDLKKAEKLLDKAGWKINKSSGIREKNGIKFSFEFLITQGSSTGKEVAIILKNNLKKIGIQMDIRTLEWSIFSKRLSQRDFQACTFSWDNTVDPDVYDLWHSSMQKNGLNMIGYNNKKLDKLLEAAKTEFNPAKRKLLSHQIHRIIHNEQPYTFLYSEKKLDIFDKRIKGIKTSLRGVFSAWPGLIGWYVE